MTKAVGFPGWVLIISLLLCFSIEGLAFEGEDSNSESVYLNCSDGSRSAEPSGVEFLSPKRLQWLFSIAKQKGNFSEYYVWIPGKLYAHRDRITMNWEQDKITFVSGSFAGENKISASSAISRETLVLTSTIVLNNQRPDDAKNIVTSWQCNAIDAKEFTANRNNFVAMKQKQKDKQAEMMQINLPETDLEQ